MLGVASAFSSRPTGTWQVRLLQEHSAVDLQSPSEFSEAQGTGSQVSLSL